jgi:hypothetical protein
MCSIINSWKNFLGFVYLFLSAILTVWLYTVVLQLEACYVIIKDRVIKQSCLYLVQTKWFLD